MLSYRINEDAELRLLQLQHAANLFALTDSNRARLREWLPWVDSTKTLADTQTFIQETLNRLAKQSGLDLGVWYKGQLAGTVGLFDLNLAVRSAEIGYWLGAEFEGMGLMTNSVKALLRYAFEELELNRIQIRVATENLKSRAIPQRLGFVLEGVLRQQGRLYDRYVDMALYSLLEAEWTNRPDLTLN